LHKNEPGDDHYGSANTTDRRLCNCEQNRQPNASVGDRNCSLTSLKRLQTISPYIGIVFAAHHDEDFGAMSLVAALRPPRSNANVDPCFCFRLGPARGRAPTAEFLGSAGIARWSRNSPRRFGRPEAPTSTVRWQPAERRVRPQSRHSLRR
jgi:hypothetical protein